MEPIEEDRAFKVAKKEAKLTVMIWCIQSAIMLFFFFALGFYRTDDPLGFPLGLPGWYLIGGIITGIVFMFIMIYVVRNKFTDVPLE